MAAFKNRKLKSLFFAAGVIAILTGCSNQNNNHQGVPDNGHFNLRVILDPVSQKLRVSGDFTIPVWEDSVDHLDFFLHKQIEIGSLEGLDISGYQMDTAISSGVAWLPDAGLLRIDLDGNKDAGDQVKMVLDYAGIIDEWNGFSANSLTEDWVELGLYFPWFPYHLNMPGFTYRIELTCPVEYQVSGLQEVHQVKEGEWILESEVPVTDMVILAAKSLKSYSLEGKEVTVTFNYLSLSDSLIREMTADCERIIHYYLDLYGPVPVRTVHIVETGRATGGGYGRLGGVVLGELQEEEYASSFEEYQRYFAHELAHLWWHTAPKDTWDDWINEGFAEYSALLYLKTLFGTEAFDRHLARKREAIVNTPPVWGLNRHDLSEEGSFQVIENVLYNKGPVLLADLETRIGLDSFLDLCRELLALEKLDTENLLIVLERIGGLEAAEEFEKALGREL